MLSMIKHESHMTGGVPGADAVVGGPRNLTNREYARWQHPRRPGPPAEVSRVSWIRVPAGGDWQKFDD